MIIFFQRWWRFMALAVGWWAFMAWLTGKPVRSILACGVIVIVALVMVYVERKTGISMTGPTRGQRIRKEDDDPGVRQ